MRRGFQPPAGCVTKPTNFHSISGRSNLREMCDRIFVLIGRSGFWVYVRSGFLVYVRSDFWFMCDRIFGLWPIEFERNVRSNFCGWAIEFERNVRSNFCGWAIGFERNVRSNSIC
ncbi:hypothetical protein [Microcoleus sp. B4-C1]|uniref:hypothetical protein n=1 Tax=Microcoleus sp. B4-C1 TaxID=2818660 RepID=UPI002FD1A197